MKRIFPYTLHPKTYNLHSGFTLIETLVAISLLTTAIVAPMSLTAQSLSSAYYARDQVTSYFLAQEALETVRAMRDNNILQQSQGNFTDLLDGLPSTSGLPFTVDTRDTDGNMTLCPGEVCPPLETNGTLYGYGEGASGWGPTVFTRSVRAEFVDGSNDEVKITVTVQYKTGRYNARTFTISENMYRWVDDLTGSSGNGAGPIINSFTANPNTITQGDAGGLFVNSSSLLSWSVTDATTVSISQGLGTQSGSSVSVSPSVTTTYVLTATNADGSATASVTVFVGSNN